MDGELIEKSDPDIFRANLQALRKRYAPYADVLSAIPESSKYVFEKAGTAVSCRVGAAWLHGPGDPWSAAKREVDDLVSDDPQLYVVFRAGMGYLPLALVEALATRGQGSLVLVVEDRLDLIKASLGLVDWEPMLRSAHTEVLLGNPYEVVDAFLKRYPAASLLPMNLVIPPDMISEPEAERLARRLVDFAENTQRFEELQLGMARVLIRERRVRREPLRVLLTVPDFGYLAMPIVEGFRACGCDVATQVEQKSGCRGLRSHDWLSRIPDFAPDLVLWMNRPELSRLASDALRELGIANVHWSVDSPRRMKLTKSELELVDLHLCFDANYLPTDGNSGARSSSQLSLAAGIQSLPGCRPSDAQWPRRLGPDITFVGSLGESRIVELRELIRFRDPDLLAYLEELGATSGDPAVAFEAKARRPYEGAACIYVDEARSARRRIDVLSALPPGSLKVFGGSEWLRAGGAVARAYGGRSMPYGLDLSSMYYHSKINVNIFHEQCIDSTNSRVYDVLAAGGFLLTEYRPCLEREFVIGKHLATFTTPEEAREKVEYYLAHPDEREEMAREGQRHVLAEHSFEVRCRKIINLLGKWRDLIN